MTCQICPPTCRLNVFDRVFVSYLIKGMTLVSYTLLDTFTDPHPLQAQLQVGTTPLADSDDWEDVGLPVTDVFSVHDPEQRVWGKSNFTHYRIKLTSPLGVYYSDPVAGMGVLDRRSWRLAREMIRQRLVAYRYGPGGQVGYILKRRWTGENCPICLDYLTNEIKNPECPECLGTGKKCGYFFPASCVWAEINPRYRRTALDGQQRGTVNDVTVQAEMLGFYLLDEGDIFIGQKLDDRYMVHKVQHKAEYRGVPIVAEVELRPLPFTSVIYQVEIPDQLAVLGLDN